MKTKKILSVISITFITLSLLSVSAFATQVSLPFAATSALSGYYGEAGYTSEFNYGHSYTGTNNFTITGTIRAQANTNRGNTSGGSVSGSIQEKVGIVWLNHSTSNAYSKFITIPNQSTAWSSSLSGGNAGVVAYTNGKTYRGRFEVGTICADLNASKVTISPTMNCNMII